MAFLLQEDGWKILLEDGFTLLLDAEAIAPTDTGKKVVKVSKIGKSVESGDPNDFIFHSSYNTFKIIKEGTKSITLTASTANQTFTENHGFSTFIPLVHAFAKRSGVSQVFAPNGADVETYTAGAGFAGDVKFNFVATDEDLIIFNFDNNKGTTVDVSIRYFLLEKVN